MPELPEVQTTVNGINRVAAGATIVDAWTDIAVEHPTLPHHRTSTKSAAFFEQFKTSIVGATILRAERRAKNIFIHLSNGNTILIHMKMTGHLMCGSYAYDKNANAWSVAPEETNEALRDPFNRYLHTVLTIRPAQLDESAAMLPEKQLVLSDVRKFAKVTFFPTALLDKELATMKLGPEPLESSFTAEVCRTQLMKKPTMAIKLALLDQSLIAGIGNIYSDEALWQADIHPLRTVASLTDTEHHTLYAAIKDVLLQGISFGGDSTSDYRDIDGKPGEFQGKHHAYRRTGKPCGKRIGRDDCTGTIERIPFHGRGAHFCPTHQK